MYLQHLERNVFDLNRPVYQTKVVKLELCMSVVLLSGYASGSHQPKNYTKIAKIVLPNFLFQIIFFV